ncbi:MAG: metalloregulator ArsR/SmtB family transcription factor [Pseudomonadota bacterium]
MPSILSIAEIGALIGDPARANILFALKDSHVVSASDLTRVAGVSPSTASEHLSKLLDAGLISVTRAGRRRYYRLSHGSVAELLDGVNALAARLAPDGPPVLRNDQAALHARPCGDHLAGRLGVALAEASLERGYLKSARNGLSVSANGAARFSALGVDLKALADEPRTLIVLCHDWSEDRFHLGGSLGGALFRSFIDRDWIRRARGAQVVTLTPKGRAGLRESFGLDIPVA